MARKVITNRKNVSRRQRRLAKSKAEAVQWLTSVPKSSGTPLEELTNDAMKEVWHGVNQINSVVSLDELLESLQVMQAAMYTSAGLEYPDDIAHVAVPTEEEVERAYGTISYVDSDEGGFEYLWKAIRQAIDVVDKWYSLHQPDKWSDDWDEDEEMV